MRSPKITDIEAQARVFRVSLENALGHLNEMVSRRHEFHARMATRLRAFTPTPQGTLMTARNQDLDDAPVILRKIHAV